MSQNQPRNPTQLEPWLAATLSLIFPGLGQFYGKQYFKGVFFLVIYFLLPGAGLLLIISRSGNLFLGLGLLGLSLVITLINIVDAYQSVKKQNSPSFESERMGEKDPWLAVFLSRLFLGLGHVYLNKWIVGIALFLFALLAVTVPIIGLVSFVVAPFVLYQSYRAAPVRRESSNRIILCVVLLSGIVAPVISLFIAVAMRTFVAEARYIPSGSMEPTLKINDRLIINKLSYRFEDPQRGDIVLFNATPTLRTQGFDSAFIHRIVGMPGDRIELKDGKVYINDEPLAEDYLTAQTTSADICTTETFLQNSITIPPQNYIVMGDNRQNSYDSRCWGFVTREDILGFASQRFWPWDRVGPIAPQR